ncbi:uncharacterized protein VTP21DRAFT_11004 [Calcarisporiella thermophila]|uniref:uncharacterized protein n=1 Tax=Calcarisporiella thermophila TaxID=911321 RepID=UPI0037422148
MSQTHPSAAGFLAPTKRILVNPALDPLDALVPELDAASTTAEQGDPDIDDIDVEVDSVKRKPSVTFEPPISDNLNYAQRRSFDTLALSTALQDIGGEPVPPSPQLDINAQLVPDEILVALLDRDKEMRDLVRLNGGYFEQIRHSLADDYEDFLNLLYVPRDELPDRMWMERVREYMTSTPCYFQKFKLLVGYDDEDEDVDDDDDDLQSEASYDEVNLAAIRGYPFKMALLEKNYPQFFVNARRSLRDMPHATTQTKERERQEEEEEEEEEEDYAELEESERYKQFCRILFTRVEELSDDEWKRSLYECLENAPNLLLQLKEIVYYETSGNTPAEEVPKCIERSVLL